MLALGRALANFVPLMARCASPCLCSSASHTIPPSAPRSAAPQAFEPQTASSLCSAEVGSSAAAVVDPRRLRLRAHLRTGWYTFFEFL
jgi:hypothetical protein